ncbi:HD domain-containing protein [Pseudodesulfovibrio sp.]|uniref:HD domain-containing protein n=1 Tax=unclassified Pseudodesulfovibrio TaxID=2661612 RepID=UPI003B00EB16
MTPSLTPHIEALTRFAESYLREGDEDGIRLKLAHSLRVLDNASSIIEGEGIQGHDAWLCRMCALYHDIGRFPQFAQFQTFNDRKSFNHGRMGVLTLRQEGFPIPVDSADGRIIRFTVGQHNLKVIRGGMKPSLDRPVRVVRDADKLDIYNVMLANFEGDAFDPIIVQSLPNEPENYTNQIYKAVLTGNAVDYTQLRVANDFLLLLLGWLKRFNFDTSLRIAHDRHYPSRIFKLLPNTPEMRTLHSQIYK